MSRITSQAQYDTPQSRSRLGHYPNASQTQPAVASVLAQATPKDELLADLITLRNRQITSAIVLLLFCFPVVIWVAKRLSSPLHNLIQLTDNIARFNFKKRATHKP